MRKVESWEPYQSPSADPKVAPDSLGGEYAAAPEWEEVRGFIDSGVLREPYASRFSGRDAATVRALLKFAIELHSAMENGGSFPTSAEDDEAGYALIDETPPQDYLKAAQSCKAPDACAIEGAIGSGWEAATLTLFIPAFDTPGGVVQSYGLHFSDSAPFRSGRLGRLGWVSGELDGTLVIRKHLFGPSIAEAAYDALMTLHLDCLSMGTLGGKVVFNGGWIPSYWWALAMYLGNGGETGICKECGHAFVRGPGRGRKREYCGDVCKERAHNARKRQKRQEEKSKSR